MHIIKTKTFLQRPRVITTQETIKIGLLKYLMKNLPFRGNAKDDTPAIFILWIYLDKTAQQVRQQPAIIILWTCFGYCDLWAGRSSDSMADQDA